MAKHDKYVIYDSEGTAFERVESEQTREGTVMAIRRGDLHDVARVVELNVPLGVCSDVSEDIALDVLGEVINEGFEFSDEARNFVYRHTHDPAVFELRVSA